MTRPRSNALTGPSDPRFVPPAHIDLSIALKKVYVIAPSLSAFLRQVFADDKIMAERTAGTLADAIYTLYSDSSGPPGPALTWGEALGLYKRIWDKVKCDPILKYGCFQYSQVVLRDLLALNDREMRTEIRGKNLLADFCYFDVPGMQGAKVRCYANAKFTHIVQVLDCLKGLVAVQGRSGICAFKIGGVIEIRSRSDTFVIYCESRDHASAVGEKLATLRDHFDISAPGMTTAIADGIALGAEPVWQATGMGYVDTPTLRGLDKERAQSFGTIRSQLIAMAIYNFNANKGVVGDTFDVFQKFVAVAFTGYGLDPANPGD